MKDRTATLILLSVLILIDNFGYQIQLSEPDYSFAAVMSVTYISIISFIWWVLGNTLEK